MKQKGFSKNEKFNNEIGRFFPIGKGLGMKEKGFAKKQKFNYEIERFCQKREI
jgi:hypothetical protein